MACTEVENVLNKFNVFTEKPVKFLSVQNDRKDDIKNLVKSLYDFTKKQEKNVKREKKGALPELIVQDFDEEQIWQQIELQNSTCWDHLVWEVANCMSAKDNLLFPVTTSEDKGDDENVLSDKNSMSEDENPAIENEENKVSDKKNKKSTLKKRTSKKTSIVDDEFFNLKDMEQFLLKEEKNDGRKVVRESDDDEESIDMFEDIDDVDEGSDGDGEAHDVMYNDFFEEGDDGGYVNSQEDDQHSEYDDDDDDQENIENESADQEATKKNCKRVRFARDISDDDNPRTDQNDTVNGTIHKKDSATIENDKKSEFELRQLRLKQHIERLEDKTMKDAPWQLKGEVDATKRPQNSLLQEVVDFDLTSRPPPIITEETTLTLEDIIIRRIKDKAWDDVVKKVKPVDDQLKFRKTEIIDQSKSKLSLAQVYEAEYLKQKQTLSGENEEEKEPESHTQIRSAMNLLFAKLDALCHYHYTPKAPQAEVKIVSNTPAISMEEVAPVATSDAALLAPEEVKKKHRGDLTSKEERSQTDRNRERRKKKQLQRGKGKVEKVTDHRNTKVGVEATDKSLKTSKAFFQQLNDDSTSLLKKGKRNVKNKGQ